MKVSISATKLTAYNVDRNVSFNNSAVSLRFEVPDAGDPRGSFAGNLFCNDVPLELLGYNAFSFWAKATQPATIGELGLGNDLGQTKFIVSASGLIVGTGWRIYIIPIPPHNDHLLCSGLHRSQ